MIEAIHPRATESLARLGVGPGDILEIAGRESVAVRVAGDSGTLWTDALSRNSDRAAIGLAPTSGGVS